MTRWLLVRHGQSVANAGLWMSGHLDVALTERGRAEAMALGERLRRERIARVVSSDLVRAVDTARLALGERAWGLRTHAGLRERHLGDWTGWSVDQLLVSGARAYLDHLDGRPPGGESLREVAHRAAATLAALDDGLPTLVVGHGGMLRVLVGLLDADVADAHIGRRLVGNTDVLVREVPRGAWARVHVAARG